MSQPEGCREYLRCSSKHCFTVINTPALLSPLGHRLVEIDLVPSPSFIRTIASRARRRRVWVLRYAFASVCAAAKHLARAVPSSFRACTWHRLTGESNRLMASDAASVAVMAEAPVACEDLATSLSPKGPSCSLPVTIWLAHSAKMLFVILA